MEYDISNYCEVRNIETKVRYKTGNDKSKTVLCLFSEDFNKFIANKKLLDEENKMKDNIVKRALCYDNWFGNIFYPLWRDLDCVCCAMWRGVVLGTLFGIALTTGVWYAIV